MSNSFQVDPRGWWFFIVDTAEVANPQWPISVAGVPIGQGGKSGAVGTAVSAAAPANALTPAGRQVMLRGVFPLVNNGANIQLRHGDGTTGYFDGKNIANSANNTVHGLAFGPLAIPLYNGLCVFVSAAPAAGSLLICYEPINF